MKTIIASRPKIEAELCKRSFYDFFLRFWETVCSEELVPNWHIKVLCDELQTVMERVFKRQPKEYDLVINISPGSTKSTICSEMLPAWCWTRDRACRLICGSYAHPLSLYLGTKSLQVIQSDKYQELYPEVDLIRESMGLVEITGGGQRIATSTGGSVTGFHGHAILIDDPLNPKEAVSEVLLKGANDWIDQTLLSRMVDKRITPFILIMQRLHQNDPTAHTLGKKGVAVRHICLPATLSDKVRPRSLRKRYIGGLFDPIRLPQTILEKTHADMGDYAYAGQYGQHPVPLGGGMFRTGEVRIEQSPPLRMKRQVRYWDKAGSAGKGAWTVGTLMGEDTHGRFWILDVVRGQWEASVREKIIRQTADRDGKAIWIAVEQEPGSGGKESAQGTMKNLAGFRIVTDRPVGDKTLRAEPFAVQVNGGNVSIIAAPWNAIWLNEFQFFPFSKFKDQVDSCSGAFAMLTGQRHRAGGL